VFNYLNEIDDLEDEVRNNADNILSTIELEKLLIDPESYLLALSDAFLNEHIDEIKKANEEGKKFAKNILSKT
jgi:hypothetical protein|tara:strand:- start:640 stop:858 length:219 start_codon:yes stop_codon:yes gene_type:complete